ncbi:MAG: VWA domain-containing protein [Saprospiraceae bacterium]|nr:VWA domain-containing protein [Saprospiraceae bacterium]
MISNISFSYPSGFLILCFILGVIYASVLYYRETKFDNHSKVVKWVLAVLRTVAVTIIALFLLGPIMKSVEEEVKRPIIVIAEDKSQSITSVTGKNQTELISKQITELAKSLSQSFEVVNIGFGSDVMNDNSDTIKNASTNLSNALQYVTDNYSDQNLGAIILATDGIYNEGNNPLYSLKANNTPLYTIALGDTTKRKDLYIQNILHNKIAYLGDKFSVQTDIGAYNSLGNSTKLTLEEISGNQTRKLYEEVININSSDFFTTRNLTIDANRAGVNKYRVNLSPVNDEQNKRNNSKEFYVEVLDARQKILLLANAPHPDLSAVKQLISENKNYEVKIDYIKDNSSNLSQFDLVIFHNLPSDVNDIRNQLNILDKNQTPRFFIVGAQTATEKFNSVQDILQIRGNSKNTEEIQGEFNPAFNMFTTSEQLRNKLKTFPPLITPFGEYTTTGASNIFLYQNIKKIKTNYPLMVFGERNGIRTGVLVGEGIWKWRIFDYLQNSNYELITELVNKSIQVISVKDDKRKFRVSTSKNVYKETENILLDAQLYNDNYEAINEPEVTINIKNDSGDEYKYTFTKIQNYYTLNAGLFSEGNYNYTALVNFGGKSQTATGRFTVESIQLEQYDLTARHSLLKNLSERNNGQIFYPNEIANIQDILLQSGSLKPVMYQSTVTKSILDIKWLFFVILFLLSLEWFLRRYFGNY